MESCEDLSFASILLLLDLISQ